MRWLRHQKLKQSILTGFDAIEPVDYVLREVVLCPLKVCGFGLDFCQSREQMTQRRQCGAKQRDQGEDDGVFRSVEGFHDPTPNSLIWRR